MQRRISNYGRQEASRIQWQSTLTSHDPNPPITIEDATQTTVIFVPQDHPLQDTRVDEEFLFLEADVFPPFAEVEVQIWVEDAVIVDEDRSDHLLVDPSEPLSPIVSYAVEMDHVDEQLPIDFFPDEETVTSTFGPLPPEELTLDDVSALADEIFPEDLTPSLLVAAYLADEDILYEILLEELVEDEPPIPNLTVSIDDEVSLDPDRLIEELELPDADVFVMLDAPWAYEEEDHPEQPQFELDGTAEEILVPTPTPAPPTPPPAPAPIQGGSLPGHGGGRTQVWNLGTPSKRYVNFAKRPAPRYPYDFWEKLSEPPPSPPAKKTSAPREIRWTQRFERTLQKDPKDPRPLYSRLLDLLRKKR